MDRRVILVVEDNTDELMIYTTLLSYHGYAVLTASDFDGALQVAREQQPDLAVIDVNLGDDEPDGCELAAALRAQPETRGMPVIAHTAYSDVYRRSLESAGCEAIVSKPSNPAVLLEAIQRIVGPGTPPDAPPAGAGGMDGRADEDPAEA